MTTSQVQRGFDVVAIGGSAGALDALATLLSGLGPEWRIPIVVVVHLPATSPSVLPSVLAIHTPLAVHDAVDKAPLEPGTVHVAIPGYHVLVDTGPSLALSVDEPVHFARPSIDVLLESAAATCRERAIGVVLSGANEDGAAGLAAVCARGGVALVQAPSDAIVDAMPRAALLRCPSAATHAARDLAPALRALVAGGQRAAR